MNINNKVGSQLIYILKIILIEVCFVLLLTSVVYLVHAIENKTLIPSYQELIYDIRLSSLTIIASFMTIWLADSITMLVQHKWDFSFVHNNIANLYSIGIYISVNVLVFLLLIPKKLIITILLPFVLALLQVLSRQVSQYFRK